MKFLFSTVAFLAASSLSFALHAQTAAPTAPATPVAPVSPAKKELVQKLMQLQQPEIDLVARSLTERPAAQLMQSASEYMQVKLTQPQRDVAAKRIEADVRKYVDETAPLVRDRAVKLVPGSIAAVYEQQFTEDELKELLAWFSSPTNRKFQQVSAEMQNAFLQKLVADTQPLTRPRLIALDAKIRVALGLPADAAAPDASPAATPRAAKPAASGAKATKQ